MLCFLSYFLIGAFGALPLNIAFKQAIKFVGPLGDVILNMLYLSMNLLMFLWIRYLFSIEIQSIESNVLS